MSKMASGIILPGIEMQIPQWFGIKIFPKYQMFLFIINKE